MRKHCFGQVVVDYEDLQELFPVQGGPLFPQEHTSCAQEEVVAGNDGHPGCPVGVAGVCAFSAEAFDALGTPASVWEMVYAVFVELGLRR